MNVDQINRHLFEGRADAPGVLPHLDELSGESLVFEVEFGLRELPEEPGVLIVRGARQYGKSTWLEGQIRATVERHGPGTAFYLNGDEIRDERALIALVRGVLPLFRAEAPVRRLFIDEITAVGAWERGLKRLLDAGELRGVLVVTTGSRATDLRRGSERLPGRKGRLERTSYLFTPISYAEFQRHCGEALGDRTLTAYLISGGCPVACAELGKHGRLPEHVPAMIRDWMYGECVATGRNRPSLLAVMDVLMQRGGSPIGQSRLARESGLANNTVAAGYVELLADLMCVGVAHAWDASRGIPLRRKRAKFPMINLLAAVAWDRARLRTPEDFAALPAAEQGRWSEWLVAQESWRRAALRGEEFPELLRYWQGADHEIDFVIRPDLLIEVKRGRTSPLDLSWFPRAFPNSRLLVVGRDDWATDRMRGLTMEQLLLDESW